MKILHQNIKTLSNGFQPFKVFKVFFKTLSNPMVLNQINALQ